MSRQCQILGIQASTGNHISHSHHATRRLFIPNLHRRRYWVPSLQRHVTLTVSTRGIKTIDAIGIDAALARAHGNGLINISSITKTRSKE